MNEIQFWKLSLSYLVLFCWQWLQICVVMMENCNIWINSNAFCAFVKVLMKVLSSRLPSHSLSCRSFVNRNYSIKKNVLCRLFDKKNYDVARSQQALHSGSRRFAFLSLTSSTDIKSNICFMIFPSNLFEFQNDFVKLLHENFVMFFVKVEKEQKCRFKNSLD